MTDPAVSTPSISASESIVRGVTKATMLGRAWSKWPISYQRLYNHRDESNTRSILINVAAVVTSISRRPNTELGFDTLD